MGFAVHQLFTTLGSCKVGFSMLVCFCFLKSLPNVVSLWLAGLVINNLKVSVALYFMLGAWIVCISGCGCAIFYEYRRCSACLFWFLFLPSI